jgi:hypothetical protein
VRSEQLVKLPVFRFSPVTENAFGYGPGGPLPEMSRLFDRQAIGRARLAGAKRLGAVGGLGLAS